MSAPNEWKNVPDWPARGGRWSPRCRARGIGPGRGSRAESFLPASPPPGGAPCRQTGGGRNAGGCRSYRWGGRNAAPPPIQCPSCTSCRCPSVRRPRLSRCSPGDSPRSAGGCTCCRCGPARKAFYPSNLFLASHKTETSVTVTLGNKTMGKETFRSVPETHLAAVHIKDVVVGEGLVGSQDHLRLSGRHCRAGPAHVDHFSGRLRPDPF